MIGLPTLVDVTTTLVTLLPDERERGSLYAFVKCFTKFLNVKYFTSIFTNDFMINENFFTSLTIFYIQTNTKKMKIYIYIYIYIFFKKIFYFKINGA